MNNSCPIFKWITDSVYLHGNALMKNLSFSLLEWTIKIRKSIVRFNFFWLIVKHSFKLYVEYFVSHVMLTYSNNRWVFLSKLNSNQIRKQTHLWDEKITTYNPFRSLSAFHTMITPKRRKKLIPIWTVALS